MPLILWGESQGEVTQHMLEKVKRWCPPKEGGKLRGLLRFVRPSYYRMNYCELLQRLEFPVAGNRVLRGGSHSTNAGRKRNPAFRLHPMGPGSDQADDHQGTRVGEAPRQGFDLEN